MAQPSAFTLVRRQPSPRLAGFVQVMTGYREAARGRFDHCHSASLVMPLIISFGSPFRIALGREPDERDAQPSFAAGIFAGPVRILSDGGAACLQVDFTPLGAFRFFGGTVTELAARMVDMASVLGADGIRLRDQLGETDDWDRRFDIVEDFVAQRAVYCPAPAIAFFYQRLRASAGTARIATLASEIGWSRTHLATRFRQQLGVGPKTVARIMRFRNACRLATMHGSSGNWAAVAAGSGFADQAHLIREFRDLAGTTPLAWARDMSDENTRRLDLEAASAVI